MFCATQFIWRHLAAEFNEDVPLIFYTFDMAVNESESAILQDMDLCKSGGYMLAAHLVRCLPNGSSSWDNPLHLSELDTADAFDSSVEVLLSELGKSDDGGALVGDSTFTIFVRL